MFDSPSILKALDATKDQAERLRILDTAIQARSADQILVNCAEASLGNRQFNFTGYYTDGASIILRGKLPAVGSTHEQDGITYFIASHMEGQDDGQTN